MKYVALDLETTGLDPNKCQIVMASFILEDTEYSEMPADKLPHHTTYITHPAYYWEPAALKMNRWIIDKLCNSSLEYPVMDLESWEASAKVWLTHVCETPITLAGKNIGSFDIQFLPPYLKKFCGHRYIEVGSVCLDWKCGRVESLASLKKRHLLGETVAHDARLDAIDVINLLRTTYNRT
jgi:oligoribonuclease (3'-5' exoribonuclease)